MNDISKTGAVTNGALDGDAHSSQEQRKPSALNSNFTELEDHSTKSDSTVDSDESQGTGTELVSRTGRPASSDETRSTVDQNQQISSIDDSPSQNRDGEGFRTTKIPSANFICIAMGLAPNRAWNIGSPSSPLGIDAWAATTDLCVECKDIQEK